MPEVKKVTDPKKIVTDKRVLKRLVELGIDHHFVEFWHDYAPRSKGEEHSPYAKFYRDLKSNKRIMVVSGLPMVKPDGTKIQVGWLKQGNRYVSRPNLFSATVRGTQITLTCLNDQPSGVKTDDAVTYRPQLFLSGIEQFPLSNEPILLPRDPANPDYKKNVLEWDFGICKRRLRIIEGRVRGSWVFNTNPNGGIRVKYNQAGNHKIKLGPYAINADEEVMSQLVFDDPESEYPIKLKDSATYYPDAHVESDTVDGSVSSSYGIGSGVVWDTMHDLVTGHLAYSEDDPLRCASIKSDNSSGKWRQIARGILLLDISGLGPLAEIGGLTLTLVSDGKLQTSTNWEVENNIYSSNPAVNTAIALADNDKNDFGTTPYCDTSISFTNWAADGSDNDFVFNAAGIAAAQAALDGDGIFKLGVRDSTQDVPDTEPTWENAKYSYANAWSVDKGGASRPKLVVTYTSPKPDVTTDPATAIR